MRLAEVSACSPEPTGPDGREHEILARYVVDASGNKSRIYSVVGGTRQYSEFFRNLALFGYFDHGKRLPAPNSGNILCEAFANSRRPLILYPWTEIGAQRYLIVARLS